MGTTDLIKQIEDWTGVTGITLDTRFDSLVDDSLDFLDLLLTAENFFGFKVPDKKYMEIQKVGDLCSYIPDYVSN